MLTFLSIPKPFRGHIEVIQRNAIMSWKALTPQPEVILVGQEPGVAETCRELDLRHLADVQTNEFGTPLVSDALLKGQAAASNDVLCYLNADIMLTNDVLAAAEIVREGFERFLMVGRRCDLDLREYWDFSHGWQDRMSQYAKESGELRSPDWIDYFIFRSGLFSNLPPLTVGRSGYDNWLVWDVSRRRIPIVDATPVVLAVHQNHDYSHLKGGSEASAHEEVEMHLRLLGTWSRHLTIAHANYVLTQRGIRRALGRPYAIARLETLRRRAIDLTRPIRRRWGFSRQDSG